MPKNMTFEEWKNKNLENVKKDLRGDEKSGILLSMEPIGHNKTGAVSGSLSGALDPDSKRAQKHADRYYNSVRKMTNDAERIAANTGFSVEDITNVKEHLFFKYHDLGGERPERFEAAYEIGESWRRLIDGRDVETHDIVLLKHELLEREYMAQGLKQEDAHRKSEEKYNYALLLLKKRSANK